jgi:hypothetical protein
LLRQPLSTVINDVCDREVQVRKNASSRDYQYYTGRGNSIEVIPFSFAQGDVKGTVNGCTVLALLNLQAGLNRANLLDALPKDVIWQSITKGVAPLSQLCQHEAEFVDINDAILHFETKVRGFFNGINSLEPSFMDGNVLELNILEDIVKALVRCTSHSGGVLMYAQHYCININKYGPPDNPSFEMIDTLSNPMARPGTTTQATQWICKDEKAMTVCLGACIMQKLPNGVFLENEYAVKETDPRTYLLFFLWPWHLPREHEG